ncbi:MAG TPA: efflux RND transporter permease subunit [Nitrospirales bacterium]|nr:efflux RND transporter permease subunit [Nitrospirales bacterium]
MITYSHAERVDEIESDARDAQVVRAETAGQHCRLRGIELHEAVVKAARTRLRPILMTSLATVFGLLPMALGLGTGGETNAPLARAVIGGLLVSTTLTLFLVPTLYTILEERFPRKEEHLPETLPAQA